MLDNINKLLYQADESNIHSPNNIEMKIIERRVKENIFEDYSEIIRDDVIRYVKED